MFLLLTILIEKKIREKSQQHQNIFEVINNILASNIIYIYSTMQEEINYFAQNALFLEISL